jgi:3-oxoacyl-[acyl-carrier protein] reductase
VLNVTRRSIALSRCVVTLIEEFKKLPPLERLGQAEDIAGVVSFLAGPDGGWVNAQVLRANGGFA